MAEATVTAYDDFIKKGLGDAQNLSGKASINGYTPYTSSVNNAPVKTQMYDFNANSPLQQINAPNYKGLMGGDYDKLQQALTQPGQQAAQNGYNSGTQNLNNAMGGRGLYGSSIMQQQQTQGLDREYMNSLASNSSNAAAQRYQMEQAGLMDLNKYNAQETAGLRGQAMNTAQVGAAESSARNQYGTQLFNNNREFNNNLNDWQNQRYYEDNYMKPESLRAFNQDDNTRRINESLALAGVGAPLQATAQNDVLTRAGIDAQRSSANKNYTAALWGAGAGLIGDIAGAYIGKK
jgi:hypothetical protein